MIEVAPDMTLMQLWQSNRDACRSIGTIVADARAGSLPGVTDRHAGHGFVVTDKDAALAAMRKN